MYLTLLFEKEPVQHGLLFTVVEDIWEYVFTHLEDFDPSLAKHRLHLTLINMHVSHRDGEPITFHVIDDRTQKEVAFPTGFSVKYMQDYYIFKGKNKKKSIAQLMA